WPSHRRWLAVLWARPGRSLPARCGLRRSHPQGREASGSAGAEPEQVRTGGQPQDRQGAWPPNSRQTGCHRRRGHRMTAKMKRREFITLLGGAAVWPLAARAQQGERMRRIGVLMNLTADDPEASARVTAFGQGLQQLGWTAGHNVRIDYRWFAADADRSRRYAAELLALAPDVVLAAASSAVAALQQATRTVPIVFAQVVDPVGAGFVDSLAQP